MSFLHAAVYKKHYPPVLNDEVWRLEKIGKDGSFHKRLNNHGIFRVEDFLRLLVRDQQKLRNVSYILFGRQFHCLWIFYFCFPDALYSEFTVIDPW